MDCPRLQTYRNYTFLDDIPQQDNWKLRQIMQFSTYPTIYNLMSYNQEYNEQPLYELDLWGQWVRYNCSSKPLPMLPLKQTPKLIPGGSHRTPRDKWAGAYRSRKGRAPWRGQYRQPSVGVPPLRPGFAPGRRPLPKKTHYKAPNQSMPTSRVSTSIQATYEQSPN